MKKQGKVFMSLILSAAVLLGTVPANSIYVSAAEKGQSQIYRQTFGESTTMKPMYTDDTADLTVVNKSGGSWENSPGGKALNVSAQSGEVRVHLTAFGDGVTAVNETAASVSACDAETVSSGNRSAQEVLGAGNPGLADGIYEISMRTGDKAFGNVGFLARYKDEKNYAGVSIDFKTGSDGKYNWTCHYSTSTPNGRENKTFANSSAYTSLKKNTDYLVELTYSGTEIRCRLKEQGSAEYIDLGSHTLSTAGYYTGPGGLAVRINPGSEQGKNLIIDNIVQKDLNGNVIKSMDFEDGTAPVYRAYTNKGMADTPALAALSIVDIPGAIVVDGFGADATVNHLQSKTGGQFLDEASPAVKSGIYTVKTNGTTNQYGLLFNYIDGQNHDEIYFDGTKWRLGGAKDNVPQAKDLNEQPPALEAGRTHTLVLDYSDITKVTLKVDGNEAALLGDFSESFRDRAGKVGFVLRGNGALYADAISLEYSKEGGEYDPGLPEVALKDGEDSYTQALTGGASTLLDNSGQAVSAITANQPPFGMEDKALSIKGKPGADDRRVKLTDLDGGPADGSYEFAFRTGDGFTYTSVGFLARYVDEGKYVGLSIDGGAWQLHAATSAAERQNTAFPNQYETLKANTTYKLKMKLVGNKVSLQVMKEGDQDYTDLGTVATQGHLDGGAFAVRLRTTSELFLDNIVQYDAAGVVVKSLDFNNGTAPAFEVRANRGTALVNSDVDIAIREGFPTGEMIPGLTPGPVSKIVAPAGESLYIDSTSPVAELGAMTVQLQGSAAKFGIVFNYADENNYATIEYDGGRWVAQGRVGGAELNPMDLSAANIPAIAAGDTRTLRLSKSTDDTGADNYTLTLSGGPGKTAADFTTYSLGSLNGIYNRDGKIGVITREAMTLYAGPMSHVYTLKSVQMPVPTTGVITLKSGSMQAVVGDSFPHIYAYLKPDGSYLTGTGLEQGKEKTGMTILTEDGLKSCATSSVKTDQTADSATYKITAADVDNSVKAVFTVELRVVDNTLELKVTDVEQVTGTVRTFAFEDLQMAAVAGRGAGAALGHVNGWGPATDTFIDLKSSSQNTTYSNMTYALFYDRVSGVAAAVENNAEDGTDKYLIRQDAAWPYISASNTAWAWKYYENTDTTKNKPYAKVVIGGDENGDGDITWQDAGISYRDIMIRAFGSENTKNEWMYIAMNMSSGASQPFLRVLDEAKAISYLTDGFGMKIMNKGYQAGGHDDSHGDYDFVGTQQGGVDDFNTLINEGLKYGIKNGVHINATEFALDGYETEEENLTKTNGELVGAWGWFDKAFHVDKSKDVANGDLERRLDDFERIVPNLDFFYVDVYQSGSNFNATEFMRYMNENGACVGTEALGDFNQQINFVHWNTDLNYSSGGAQSEVLKFVTFGLGDLAAPDRALLGALMPGIADWRNSNDFNAGERVFYRNNLPAKYLQHFELLSWTPDQGAKLSGNVSTAVKEENGVTYTEIYKDGKLIARINTTKVKKYAEASGNPMEPAGSEIFIPWSPETEDKIYCYNDANAAKEWQLPDSWAGVTQAYLYPLTENGRDTANAKIVNVSGGRVNLTLELGEPYILVKQEEAQAHRYNADGAVMTENGSPVLLPAVSESGWGYGSKIKNFGFTGKTFENWTKNAAEGAAGDIAIDTTIRGTKGNPRVVIPESVAGGISQTIDVTPGKTYSVSAWTMAEGNRSPKLTVAAGDTVEEAEILTTAGIPIAIKPSKYTGMNYQRLKVDITIPAGVTKATVTFSAERGDQPVYVDDFRCWEWLTAPNSREEKYYYFEDFENVDENWGPFISQVGNQPFIHLSYKNPQGGQMKYYTLDTYDENGNPDTTNLTSLKGRQKDSYTNGVMMRTLPSTLDFKKGASYLVELDHATYLEELFALNGRHVGYNYPLSQALYYMDVRSADGTIIESHPLKPSTFREGDEGYNARPSTEKLSFVVDAAGESGIYLTLRRDLSVYQTDPNGDKDARPTFVIDNVRVSELHAIEFDTTPANAVVEVKDTDNKVIAPQSGKKYLLQGGSYSYAVTAEGYKTKTGQFTVSGAADIKVELEKETVAPATYKVTFATTPADAAVTVKDAAESVIRPQTDGSYLLQGGSYSYTATAEGYKTKTGQFTVSGAADIKVELERETVAPVTYKVTFATTPADAAVTVKDAAESVMRPQTDGSYLLKAGSYSYAATAEGYKTKTGQFTVSGAADIKVVLQREADGKPGDTGEANVGNDSDSYPQEIVTEWNRVEEDLKNAVKEAAGKTQASDKILNIVTGNEIVVTSNILKNLKGQPVTMAFHTGQGLTFSLSGTEIIRTAGEAKLNLTARQGANAIPASIMGPKLNGTLDNRKISIVDTDGFGVNVNMHLSLGTKNAGKYANLYRFDKNRGQLIYLGSYRITEKGQAMFGIRRGGEFLVTVTQNKPNEKAAGGVYTVTAGDTLSRIAARHGMSLAELMAINPQIRDTNRIRLGQQVIIQ